MTDSAGSVKLTINKSLTQTLLDYVNKNNLKKSDGTITRAEWNATIDKLAEIQEARISNGGASIFRGGSDKTNYRENFLVNQGDEIEFSESEMKSLFEAMGVEIEANPSSGSEQPPKTDEEPPQTGVNPPQRDKVYNIPKSEFMPRDLNPPTAESEDVYDANGNKTQEIHRESDGSVDYYVDKKYDANGNVTREIDCNSDGSVKGCYDYEYDANGNATRKIYRNPDGSVEEYRDVEYNANGNITRIIYRNPDGSVDYYYVYNSDGEGTKYDASGNEISD